MNGLKGRDEEMGRICDICGAPHLARGRCSKCYQQLPDIKKKKQEWAKQHYRKCREKELKHGKEYYLKNKEKIKKQQKKYRQKPKIRAKRRIYMKKYNKKPDVKKREKKYYQLHKETIRQRAKNHYRKNRGKIIKTTRKYSLKNRVQRNCKICDKPFFAGKYTHTKYCSHKCAWKDEECVAKIRKSSTQKPNKKERKLNEILQKLCPKEYKYVGGFAFMIDGKNPDFINVGGQKKLIEFFGDYWHGERRTGKTNAEAERIRKAHYTKFGWKTLIIWEHELKNVEALEEKIRGFHNDEKVKEVNLNAT